MDLISAKTPLAMRAAEGVVCQGGFGDEDPPASGGDSSKTLPTLEAWIDSLRKGFARHRGVAFGKNLARISRIECLSLHAERAGGCFVKG